MDPETFATFEDFWPYYVREHAAPATRRMHFAGTTAAMALLASFARSPRGWKLPLALVAGYGPAWISHFFIEKNRPATFRHPLWSLRADMKMFGLMVRGAMDEEVRRVVGTHRDGPAADRTSPAAPAAGPPSPDRSLN